MLREEKGRSVDFVAKLLAPSSEASTARKSAHSYPWRVAVQSWEVASDLEPLDVRDLFRDERAALVALLRDLGPEMWGAPTVCPGWDVHDISLHLLDNDAGRLSSRRDGHSRGSNASFDYVAMAKAIDEENEGWVRATRHLSPRLVTALLSFLGNELDEYLADIDPWQEGVPVAWSGTGPTPNWLDIAREYTERWVHQQQIREAVGRPDLLERRWLHPVLDTFMRSLPRAYDTEEAPLGTSVVVTILGSAGGRWAIVRDAARSRLVASESVTPAAEVSLHEGIAWRLLSRMTSPGQAAGDIRLIGDRALGLPATRAVAVMNPGA